MHVILAFREAEASLDYKVTIQPVLKTKKNLLPQNLGRSGKVAGPSFCPCSPPPQFLIKPEVLMPAPTIWDVNTQSQGCSYSPPLK